MILSMRVRSYKIYIKEGVCNDSSMGKGKRL